MRVPNLRIVPPSQPDEKQAAIERVKKMPKRFDGMLQCNKCGGRTTATLRNGSRIENGRLIPGTLIDSNICADCFKRGVWSNMLPDAPREVKPPKPRRTKPRAIK